jgi:hypothetical protein
LLFNTGHRRNFQAQDITKLGVESCHQNGN